MYKLGGALFVVEVWVLMVVLPVAVFICSKVVYRPA